MNKVPLAGLIQRNGRQAGVGGIMSPACLLGLVTNCPGLRRNGGKRSSVATGRRWWPVASAVRVVHAYARRTEAGVVTGAELRRAHAFGNPADKEAVRVAPIRRLDTHVDDNGQRWIEAEVVVRFLRGLPLISLEGITKATGKGFESNPVLRTGEHVLLLNDIVMCLKPQPARHCISATLQPTPSVIHVSGLSSHPRDAFPKDEVIGMNYRMMRFVICLGL
jgi:hypothetical protein